MGGKIVIWASNRYDLRWTKVALLECFEDKGLTDLGARGKGKTTSLPLEKKRAIDGRFSARFSISARACLEQSRG